MNPELGTIVSGSRGAGVSAVDRDAHNARGRARRNDESQAGRRGAGGKNTASVPPPCLATVICAEVPLLGWRLDPEIVTRVPLDPLFGLKSVMVGALVAAVTVKPLTSDATSMPVVIVTVRGPGDAVDPIVRLTDAWVALVIVVLLIVIPAPKLATVAFCTKCEKLPVMETVRLWPTWPVFGVTFVRLAAGSIVSDAVLELAKATLEDVAPASDTV